MDDHAPVTSEKNASPRLVLFTLGGILLAWIMLAYFNHVGKPTGPAVVRNPPPVRTERPVQRLEDRPYSESALRSMNAKFDHPPGVRPPRPVAIKPDGTIVYEQPAERELTPEEKKREEMLARIAAISQRPRGAGHVEPGSAKPDIRLSPEVVEYIRQLKESGELDTVIESHYRQMLERYNQGYGPEGGPSLEEIERIRRQGLLPLP